MGAVSFSIDEALARRLQQELSLTVFVETGTFEGDSIARLLPLFEEIHSIEISSDNYTLACERFRSSKEVQLHLGDSADVLAAIRPLLHDRPVLYWLDAHWCGSDETATELSQCPLLSEITALGELNAESVVLIDDARLFLSPPPHPHDIAQWPGLHEILQGLFSLSSTHEVMVVNDVIAFYPASIRTAMTDYAQSNAVDLFASRARLDQLEQEVVELVRERDLQAEAAEQRLQTIQELTEASAERLETIEALERDRDLHRQAAEDRLAELVAISAELESRMAEARGEITRLEQERDLQTQAAAERLETIEALEGDRDLHRQAAEERLAALNELSLERDRKAVAAEQRLAAIEGLDRDRNAHSERGHDGWR